MTKISGVPIAACAAARIGPTGGRRLSVLEDRTSSIGKIIRGCSSSSINIRAIRTNWWIPNRACAEAMLRSAGFQIVDHPEDEVYICKEAREPLAGGPDWLKRHDLERAE